MQKTFLLLSIVFLCAGCAVKTEPPKIKFIGIGTGTLATDVRNIRFQETFDVHEQQLLGVVAFEEVSQGTNVQATWFSPDERRMPLGRTQIKTQSGATVARFSFASKEPWQPAPYMLRIDATVGEGEKTLTASGSVSFFIGMTQKEIAEYRRQFEEWSKADAAHRAEVEARIEAEKAVVDRVKQELKSEDANLIMRHDLTNDGMDEFLVGSTGKKDDMPPSGGGGPGIVASGEYQQFVLTDLSGSSLLALKRNRSISTMIAGDQVLVPKLQPVGLVTVTVLPSGTFSLMWKEKKTSCTLELRLEKGKFVGGEPVCR